MDYWILGPIKEGISLNWGAIKFVVILKQGKRLATKLAVQSIVFHCSLAF